jgi:chitosanase
MCFGDSVSGNVGHGEHDVLYLAFPGKAAVPAQKAKWDAKSKEEFEESLARIGDQLVSSL